jgi:hypothetical protein
MHWPDRIDRIARRPTLASENGAIPHDHPLILLPAATAGLLDAKSAVNE